VNARPARDRLAVWTYQQAGEEIPAGDPSVTDAERSAAGRETVAARASCQAARRSGLPCRHEEWVGGHDHLCWEQQLPIALGWLLAPS